MIDNSLKSGVVLALQAGSWGVNVPHELNWAMDHTKGPEAAERYRDITHLGEAADPSIVSPEETVCSNVKA